MFFNVCVSVLGVGGYMFKGDKNGISKKSFILLIVKGWIGVLFCFNCFCIKTWNYSIGVKSISFSEEKI